MASGTSSADLALDDQRVLLAIRSSQEKDELGYQRADFSQLREWLDWKYDRLDYRIDKLEQRGLISISHRSPEEVETNRDPPRLATLTESARELIKNRGLKDAMFEKIPETADPRTYDELFKRLDVIESLLEEHKQESITYYEKWSSVLTKLRTAVTQHEDSMASFGKELRECRQRISTVLATLYTEDEGSRDYSGVNLALDHLQEQMAHLRTVQATHDDNLNQTAQRAQTTEIGLRELEHRVTAIEEYLRENGHRWQPQRFETDEK
jgi:DNA-binding MarR family transcriptional regulator